MNVTTTKEQHPCSECGTPHEVSIVKIEGREFGRNRLCPKCAAIAQAEAEQRQKSEERGQMRDTWNQICPPLYQETDIEQIPISDTIKTEVLTWKVQPEGIGLVGKSGVGKTRLLYKLLERLHSENRSVAAISSKAFERACGRMFEKDISSRELIESCESAPILLLDDLGKERFTERVESELYNLIEVRTSHKRPILWTSNTTSTRLKEMLSQDRGEPIIRRIKEFSRIITV